MFDIYHWITCLRTFQHLQASQAAKRTKGKLAANSAEPQESTYLSAGGDNHETKLETTDGKDWLRSMGSVG